MNLLQRENSSPIHSQPYPILFVGFSWFQEHGKSAKHSVLWHKISMTSVVRNNFEPVVIFPGGWYVTVAYILGEIPHKRHDHSLQSSIMGYLCAL